MPSIHKISLRTPNLSQHQVRPFAEAVQVMHDVREIADRFRAEEGGYSDLDTSEHSVTLNKASLPSRAPQYSGVVTFEEDSENPFTEVGVIAESFLDGEGTETYYGYSQKGDVATYTRNHSRGETQNHTVHHNLVTDTITYQYH